MTASRSIRRRRALSGAALAIVLGALPCAPALARTPTPSITPTITDGPSPTITGSMTPTATGTQAVPYVDINASPNPARSGQRVTLDGSRNPPFGTYEWAQVGGDVGLEIEDADQPIAHFIAPDVAVMTYVRVQLSVSGHNSGPRAVDILLLPTDLVLSLMGSDGSGSAPPGEMVSMSVVLRLYGLAVTGVEHEMGFGRFAPVVDRGDGVPDCQPGRDLSVLSASFAFVPDGCVETNTCTGVHASLTTRYAIPDYGIAYRCTVTLADEPSPPEEGCSHKLTCVGGTATGSAGQALTVQCPEGSDGRVSANYALRPLGFDLRAEPAAPNVGDDVRITVSVRGEGGLARYDLRGAEPILHGPVSVELNGPLASEVSFDLHADCPGTALLSLSINYETLFGCPGNTFYAFTSQGSSSFPLTVRDPGTFRVTGRVADQPSECSGGTRVPVRLEPLGWTATSDSDGEFAFDGVPPGDYTISIASGCGRFHCWPVEAVHVGTQDVDMPLCPQRLAGDACIGDCDLNRTVSVDELIVGVGMLLGRRAFEDCPAVDVDGDGAILVNELIAAVDRALRGCSASQP